MAGCLPAFSLRPQGGTLMEGAIIVAGLRSAVDIAAQPPRPLTYGVWIRIMAQVPGYLGTQGWISQRLTLGAYERRPCFTAPSELDQCAGGGFYDWLAAVSDGTQHRITLHQAGRGSPFQDGESPRWSPLGRRHRGAGGAAAGGAAGGPGGGGI